MNHETVQQKRDHPPHKNHHGVVLLRAPDFGVALDFRGPQRETVSICGFPCLETNLMPIMGQRAELQVLVACNLSAH